MRLYLIQHGKALPEEIDPKRSLSDEGKADVERMASFLKEKKISVDSIWHSEKLRAKQTAQILGEKIQPKEGLREMKELAPLAPVEGIAEKIIEENKDIMLVGHLPFLQKLASLILTKSTDYHLINFSQGGCVCLEGSEGVFSISWIIKPELIK